MTEDDIIRYKEDLEMMAVLRSGRVNTLAHYMAINDDLYCQVIWRKFAMAQNEQMRRE